MAMKLISVCGPPSAGKTATIIKVAENWKRQDL